MEYVRIPNNIEANFQLKSSRGREGINHSLAGYIDPGFCGQITLELQNVRQRHSVLLRPGMLIGQLRFGKLDDVPLRPYSVTERYMNDTGAVESKGEDRPVARCGNHYSAEKAKNAEIAMLGVPHPTNDPSLVSYHRPELSGSYRHRNGESLLVSTRHHFCRQYGQS